MRLKLNTFLGLSLAAIAPLQAAHAQTAPAKPHVITFVQSLTGNPFYDTVACGGVEAAKRLNVTFNAQGPQQYQPALQMRVLDAVIASHPEGILFAATDPVAMTPTLLQAKAMGIRSSRSTATSRT